MGASSRGKRRYVLKARGDQVAATRRRIIEATVALHEEVGPRRTTIKAIAERAGVERLTVYRHFPDERAVLAACSACWSERHPAPDPREWQRVAEPAARTRLALGALYGYFGRQRRMLAQVHRDLAEWPALAEVAAPFHAYLRAIADDLTVTWGGGTARGAVLQHAVQFPAWALWEEAGWNNDRKVLLLLRWVGAVGDDDGASPGSSGD